MMDNNHNNIDIYNRHVTAYMNKFMDLDLYKDTFGYLLDVLPPGGNVLELGCGPGNVIRYIRSKRPDLQLMGIDLAPNMIEAAKKANPGVAFEVSDIRRAGEIDRVFDAVLAPFCIPYLAYADMVEVFTTMRKLTTGKKGIIYLSCMEGLEEKSGFEKTSFTGEDEMYINYYPRTAIEDLIKQNGFAVKQFYTKDYPEADGSVTTDLVYIAGHAEE